MPDLTDIATFEIICDESIEHRLRQAVLISHAVGRMTPDEMASAQRCSTVSDRFLSHLDCLVLYHLSGLSVDALPTPSLPNSPSGMAKVFKAIRERIDAEVFIRQFKQTCDAKISRDKALGEFARQTACWNIEAHDKSLDAIKRIRMLLVGQNHLNRRLIRSAVKKAIEANDRGFFVRFGKMLEDLPKEKPTALNEKVEHFIVHHWCFGLTSLPDLHLFSLTAINELLERFQARVESETVREIQRKFGLSKTNPPIVYGVDVNLRQKKILLSGKRQRRAT